MPTRAALHCSIIFIAVGLLSPLPAFAQAPPAPLSKLEEQAKSQMESAIKLKEEGRPDAAVEVLQKLVADLPQSAQVPQAYLLLGQILTEQKNHDEAGGYYRRLLAEKFPRMFPAAVALLRLMELYETAGDDYKVARVARDFLAQFSQHERAPAVFAAQVAQRQKLKTKAVRIGALLPLTGPLSPYGTQVLNGTRLALELAAEAAPTLAVGLVTKDTEGDARIFARELEDLLREFLPTAV